MDCSHSFLLMIITKYDIKTVDDGVGGNIDEQCASVSLMQYFHFVLNNSNTYFKLIYSGDERGLNSVQAVCYLWQNWEV